MAYLTVIGPRLDFEANRFAFTVINTGHIPTGDGTMVAHYALITVPQGNLFLARITTKYWTEGPHNEVYPGTGTEITMTLDGLNRDAFLRGEQAFIIVGDLTYNDGFPGTTMKHLKFCASTPFDPIARRPDIALCEAEKYLPQAIQGDEYPSSRYKRTYVFKK